MVVPAWPVLFLDDAAADAEAKEDEEKKCVESHRSILR
jgi:hypothetical protein